MITLNSIHKCRLFVLFILLNAVFISSVFGRRGKSAPPPSLVRDVDIKIWDEDHLRGYNGKTTSSRGEGKNFKRKSTWTLTTDFWSQRGWIEENVKNGKYGKSSSKTVYTTYRPLVQLSNEEYAEGKKTILDNQVSNLVTPAFEVKLDYITFLISGGYEPGKACINLLVDGKVVRTATGRNSDYLEWVAFDVKEFKGKEARVQIVDETTSCFGYITVDCICQSPDKKEAVRVIRSSPKTVQVGSSLETLDAELKGVSSLKGSSLFINGKNVAIKNILKFSNSVDPGDPNARRIELVNGDRIICDASAFENNKLQFKHSLLGEKSLGVESLAQIKFAPGPSVDLKPGIMLHENGNKIPGELTWIRANNISIKCALGQLPLPLARVNAFVFNDKSSGKNEDQIILKDGSCLSGEITIEGGLFILKHSSLGSLNFNIGSIAEIILFKPNINQLSALKYKVTEKSGPLTPPEPDFITNGAQNLLRIYPASTIRFTLPESKNRRRFKSTLKTVANCATTMSVLLRSGNQEKKITVEPDSKGVAVDFALQAGQALEMVINSKNNVSYPSGVEWHGAIIIEDKK